MQDKALTIQQIKNLLESIKDLSFDQKSKILTKNRMTEGDFHDLLVAVVEFDQLDTSFDDVEAFAYSAFKTYCKTDRENLIETLQMEHEVETRNEQML